jgi:glutamyl-tRNA synthetase
MNSNVKPVRVRFAPSPTGHTHLGSGRTALYNYLLARQTNGQFILRIEDTDTKRFVPGTEQELIDSLYWLGLSWDEGVSIGGPHAPYRQSERKEIYLVHAHNLIEDGHAYYCFCSPERLHEVRQYRQREKLPKSYDGLCRGIDPEESLARVNQGESHVIRFKTPVEGSITAYDRMRGAITVENRNIDDYILIKSDGMALYHFAAMVDDHLMGITHVIRGSEWLSTFPLHVHILRAFGWQEPDWVHLSVFLKPSGKGKMSKRESSQLMKDGYSIFIKDLEELGYLPEAVINWVALMGWSYDDHTEFFTLDDLIEKFNLDNLNPAPAAINFSKLDHFNGLHIRNLEIKDLTRRIKPFFEAEGYRVDDAKLEKITPIIQERLSTLDDAPQIAGFFFEEMVNPHLGDLVGKKLTPSQAIQIARETYKILESLPEFSAEEIQSPLRELVEELGLTAGQVFGVLRVAVTGRSVSPPLFESMEIIGRGSVLERIQNAIGMLEDNIRSIP